MRFQSKADGTYRIVGLPGPAIVGAESILKSYRAGVGYSDVAGTEVEGGQFDTYRNPMMPLPTWPTMMKEIKVTPKHPVGRALCPPASFIRAQA